MVEQQSEFITDRLPGPLFALTMGDPAGIGPEIAIKASEHSFFREHVVVVGDALVLERETKVQGSSYPVNSIATVNAFRKGCVNVLDCGRVKPDDFKQGIPQALCGHAAFAYIERSIALALDGTVDGVITNPICKEALARAGIEYPGHTEIFAHKTGTRNVSMMFFLRNVGVAHVTTHCSLRDAIERVTRERVIAHILLLNTALRQLGFSSPRIAVGGLNPHAGENGMFGNEEGTIIAPAIADARSAGISVCGPFPPDTVFMRAFKGEFDGVVAMLHDHGFVALKSMDFKQGVNITIGLPIIRTSVGHGTAFDIVGKGVAHAESLIAAFDAAKRLKTSRKRVQ